MTLLRRRQPALPPSVAAALGLPARDRVLVFAVDVDTGAHVVASRYALSVVHDDERQLRKPWSAVADGTWQPDQARLTVAWADSSRPVSWAFGEQQTLLPETLRERVQGSVVLTRQLALPDRRFAQVAVRRDFETEELFTQVVLGRRVRRDDPEVRAVVDAVLADLRDQTGLSPTADPW